VGVTVCAIDLPGRSYCWDSSGYGGAVLGDAAVELPATRAAQFIDVGLDRACQVSGPDWAECFRVRSHSTEGANLSFERFEYELGIENALQLSVGGRHACITGHGHLSCWGANEHGQVGAGDLDPQEHPIQVDLGEPVMHVTTGWHHTCAILASGGVQCWGDNSFGQLGNGTTRSTARPVRVRGLEQPAVRIAAGMGHTCAVTADRQIHCWGLNEHGQLGDGTFTNRSIPTPVRGLHYVE